MNLVFNLFDTCNLNCKYCFKKDIKDHKKLALNPMKSDVINQIVEDAVSKWKHINISITGGEPCLDKKTILSVLGNTLKHDQIKRVSITTNGTLISSKFAEQIKSVCPDVEIDISIDGPPEIHNLLRPTKENAKSHALAINGLKNAKSAGLNIVVNSVITKHHLNLDIKKYYDYMESLEVRWMFGKCITNNDSLEMTESQFDDFIVNFLILWSSDSNSKSNILIDSLILKAIDKIPFSKTARCSNAILSFAGREGFAWPCTKLIPHKEFCLGSYDTDGLDKILLHPLRNEIYNLFQNNNTCAHESLIKTGTISPLPKIACERDKIIDFFKEAFL